MVTLVLGTSAGHGTHRRVCRFDHYGAGLGRVHSRPAAGTEPLSGSWRHRNSWGAAMHTAVGGVASNLGETEQDCFSMARYFLSRCPHEPVMRCPSSGTGRPRRHARWTACWISSRPGQPGLRHAQGAGAAGRPSIPVRTATRCRTIITRWPGSAGFPPVGRQPTLVQPAPLLVRRPRRPVISWVSPVSLACRWYRCWTIRVMPGPAAEQSGVPESRRKNVPVSAATAAGKLW